MTRDHIEGANMYEFHPFNQPSIRSVSHEEVFARRFGGEPEQWMDLAAYHRRHLAENIGETGITAICSSEPEGPDSLFAGCYKILVTDSQLGMDPEGITYRVVYATQKQVESGWMTVPKNGWYALDPSDDTDK